MMEEKNGFLFCNNLYIIEKVKREKNCIIQKPSLVLLVFNLFSASCEVN